MYTCKHPFYTTWAAEMYVTDPSAYVSAIGPFHKKRFWNTTLTTGLENRIPLLHHF
ncbi:hypothetical protein [Bacillus atrophaeus]|uniref:hypothetical protein n=1 Tax=Bacillus atrophaeus TaxID=1452 RepID=UPI002DBCDB81|nr:hypothetical protein [Bacillus atrophaeus]MEC0833720.1 hypothetical protein [Bacillus atrophaeus]MEC0904508.1 hypothetical protein [Bacillus atrophaeus]MEC0989514.1 hypothetical protein [Bacillus atrophaeus]